MTYSELVKRVNMYLRGMGKNGKPVIAPDCFGLFRIVGGIRHDGERDVLYEGFFGNFACAVVTAIHYDRFYGHVCGDSSFDDDLRSWQNGYVERIGGLS